jgi:hypothetical protein
MIPHEVHRFNSRTQLLVPEGAEFTGPDRDYAARLAHILLLKTMTQRERQDYGHFIPFSQAYGRAFFGGNWHRASKAARTQFSHIFDFNDRYWNGPGSFSKSIRLKDDYRTGKVQIYECSRAIKHRSFINEEELDTASRRLIKNFDYFSLPNETPEFENPWQALTWTFIVNKQYYTNRCRFRRFHSNFTSFKHRYLLESNKDLCALDIVACQPLILGIVVLQSCDEPDVHRWLEICSKDDIYLHIASLMNTDDRKAVKASMIRCLFERKTQMENMTIFKVLLEHFPTIAAFLSACKQAQGHQCVAHMCQRLEADIMIDKVTSDLRDTPLITVHDELILYVKQIERAKRFINKRFAVYGVTPRYKVTLFEDKKD